MQPATCSSRSLEGLIVIVVFALSVLSWFAATWIAHTDEAWDSASYLVTALPLSILLGAFCGRAFGRANWRWPLAFMAGQFAGLVMLSHGNGSLWPLTLAILFVLSLPCWCAALLASLWRKRTQRSVHG